LTNAQIDKLGDRIRGGLYSDHDLHLLAEYRVSFRPSYLHVAGTLKEQRVEVTGRTKSNISIERKLKRQRSLRLSKMQDIEGCRIVVPDFETQEARLTIISVQFPNIEVVDRRKRPSHGYRAVHVIVTAENHPVEVQVRTTLQHLWAELSERMADELTDPAVKYGGGPKRVRELLSDTSERIAFIEEMEQEVFRLKAEADYRPRTAAAMRDLEVGIQRAEKDIEERKGELVSILGQSVAILERAKLKRKAEEP
jgi:GTP pyrophosphokinase